MYHRIGQVRRGSIVPGHYVSTKLFRSHVAWFAKRGYRSVSLRELRLALAGETSLPKLALAITFDDGLESFFSAAIPVLREFGFTATVFAVTDCVGGINEWDVLVGDVEEPLMGVEQLRECERQGFEVGSHTKSHANLAECDDVRLKEEIVGSKSALEDLLGHSVASFCYPYGKHTVGVRQVAASAGYEVVCTTEKGLVTPDSDPLALPRINIRSDTWPFMLARKLRQAERSHSPAT